MIVGGGPELASLRSHAKSVPVADAIVFTGATTVPEFYLRRMDIFAVTSDTEQMPLSVLEAMASGLPIVSFGVGDIPNMVSKENKIYASIDRRSNEEFVTRTIELIDAPDLRAKLGKENALKIQSDFSLNRMAGSYSALFDRDAFP